MSFDIIEKLIRLANNNPNDNEANAAARKVCQMLKDHKFNNSQSATASMGTPPGTWSGFTRPKDPFWRSSSYQPPSNPTNEKAQYDHEKARREAYERTRRREEETRRNVEEEFWKKFNKKYSNPYADDYADFDPFNVEYSKPKIQQLRCKDCGISVKTGFVGPPQMFQCIACQQDEISKRGKWTPNQEAK